MMVKIDSGVIRFQKTDIDTYIRFHVSDKDPQRIIIVFYQCGSKQMYYLGTVRVNVNNTKSGSSYVILDDLSTEFTMDEVMDVFDNEFKI